MKRSENVVTGGSRGNVRHAAWRSAEASCTRFSLKRKRFELVFQYLESGCVTLAGSRLGLTSAGVVGGLWVGCSPPLRR